MDLFADYIDPAELTGYVRAALADIEENQFQLSRWLPSQDIDDLEYRFTSGGEGLVEAATFRQYDTPAPFGRRPGLRRISGELPPISRQLSLGEYNRLRARRAADNAVLNSILNDGVRMTRSVAARVELARGEALYKGKLEIAENGVVATVDFGRSAAHTTASQTPWTTLSADALGDLIAWTDIYAATNGAKPDVMLTSQRVSRLLQRNTSIINAVAGAQTGRTRITLDELNALLESEGLPRLVINDQKIAVGGVTTRVIPDNRVVLLPEGGQSNDPESSQLGKTLWGTTAESFEAEYGIEDGEEPGIVAGNYKIPDPVVIYTKAAGIALPVLANPNLTFTASVAA